jgi:hypothetical protein
MPSRQGYLCNWYHVPVIPEHKLATADAIVYASVLESGAMLLTCDAHLEGLADVVYVGQV